MTVETVDHSLAFDDDFNKIPCLPSLLQRIILLLNLRLKCMLKQNTSHQQSIMKTPEQIKEYNRQYYLKNREKIIKQAIERNKVWEENNREKKNERCRAERRENREEVLARQRKSRQKLKTEVMGAYGGKCTCCGEDGLEFLTIDHINGGGNKHRKQMRNGSGDIYRLLKIEEYPEGYQVLCFNCNSSKHFGNGICFHKRKQLEP